jgi:hypothetical protein
MLWKHFIEHPQGGFSAMIFLTRQFRFHCGVYK